MSGLNVHRLTTETLDADLTGFGKGRGRGKMFTHILLEVYCIKDEDEVLPIDCLGDNTSNYQCLFNKCKYCSFTSCENAFGYSNENSEVKDIVVLSGEMIKEDSDVKDHCELCSNWKNICIKKIDEAYESYMENINKN